VRPKYVAILEDHRDRAAAMRRLLARELPHLNVVIFDASAEMIEWLERSLPDTVLVSLDHDLLPRRPPGGGDDSMKVVGTGREVADFLATYPCVCPVIVHSSNSHAVPGMIRELREARWVCSAVTPCDGISWIAGDWWAEVNLYRQRGLLFW
jgi:hypothetical protein